MWLRQVGSSDEADAKPFSTYVVGVVGWSALHIALAVLVLAFFMFWCIGRYCLAACGLNLCGSRYPTAARGMSTCYVGFRGNRELREGFSYGKGRWMNRVCLWITLLVLLVAILVGDVYGVQRVRPSLKAIPASFQVLLSSRACLLLRYVGA